MPSPRFLGHRRRRRVFHFRASVIRSYGRGLPCDGVNLPPPHIPPSSGPVNLSEKHPSLSWLRICVRVRLRERTDKGTLFYWFFFNGVMPCVCGFFFIFSTNKKNIFIRFKNRDWSRLIFQKERESSPFVIIFFFYTTVIDSSLF